MPMTSLQWRRTLGGDEATLCPWRIRAQSERPSHRGTTDADPSGRDGPAAAGRAEGIGR